MTTVESNCELSRQIGTHHPKYGSRPVVSRRPTEDFRTNSELSQSFESQQENSLSLFALGLAVKENYVPVALITSHCTSLIGPTSAEFQNISNTRKMFLLKINCS